VTSPAGDKTVTLSWTVSAQPDGCFSPQRLQTWYPDWCEQRNQQIPLRLGLVTRVARSWDAEYLRQGQCPPAAR
jgi:hypothetical protein